MRTMTQGEALRMLGFATTAWDDVTLGHPGIRKSGVFDPTKDDIHGRYGLTSLSGIEFPPEQKVGAHSWGLANDVLDIAAEVLARVAGESGKTVVLDHHAQLDFDLVRGATERVIEEGLRIGLISQPVTVPPVVPVPPVAPTQPPAPPNVPPVDPMLPVSGTGLHALSPARVRVEELRIMADGLILPKNALGLWFAEWTDEDWPQARPFAIELLRLYRLLRRWLGDTRVIPAEDR